MTKTVNEQRTETISQTLYGRTGHCPTGGFLELKIEVWTLFGLRQILSGGARHCPVGDLWKTWFSPKICPFLPKFDSWATVLQIKWKLDTRITSTQETSSQQRFFSKSNDFPSDFAWTQKLRFWGNEEKFMKSKGLEPWIHSKVEGRWWGSS
jgi:hypothetical protein